MFPQIGIRGGIQSPKVRSDSSMALILEKRGSSGTGEEQVCSELREEEGWSIAVAGGQSEMAAGAFEAAVMRSLHPRPFGECPKLNPSSSDEMCKRIR
ncbi:hypothetical protein AOLI_G00115450 [Acnodon oligacanthus]